MQDSTRTPCRDPTGEFAKHHFVAKSRQKAITTTTTMNERTRKSMHLLRYGGAHLVGTTPGADDSGYEMCSSRLRPLLECGAIVLLDCQWLLEFGGPQLPRRQDLPPAAFFTGAVDFQWANMVVLSYMWLSAQHPDPEGMTLRLVQEGLRRLILDQPLPIQRRPRPTPSWYRYLRKDLVKKAEADAPRFGIFWDYACLFQHPRRQEQQRLFEQALEGMPYLYIHPSTTVFQVTRFPAKNMALEGRSNLPYHQRGWPVAEQAWASLVKNQSYGKVYDLSLAPNLPSSFTKIPSHVRHLFVSLLAQKTRRAPRTPEAFDGLAETLSFSNGKEDHELVKQLYRRAVTAVLRCEKRLLYNNLGWTTAEMGHLVDVIIGGYVPRVTEICLNSNPLIGDEAVSALYTISQHVETLQAIDIGLTSVGCQAFMNRWNDEEVLASSNPTSKLRCLDWSRNSLGDDGFACLAPFIMQIPSVKLQVAGITAKGCRRFVENLRQKEKNSSDTSPERIRRLNLLDLSGNHELKGTGLGILAAVWLQVANVNFGYVSLTGPGCKALVSCLPSDLLQNIQTEKLHLIHNTLDTVEVGALAPLLIRIQSVKWSAARLTKAACEGLGIHLSGLDLSPSHLIDLDMSDNPEMTDHGVRSLALFWTLPTLRRFSLAGNNLSDDTSRFLAELSRNSTLAWETVDLSRNQLHDAGAVVFIVQGVASLKHFLLHDNSISDGKKVLECARACHVRVQTQCKKVTKPSIYHHPESKK